MRIAVTGGNGDLGRVLVSYLAAQGHAVVSLDLSMPAAPAGGDVRHMIADTRDFGEVVAALHACDGVVHLAAHRAPGLRPDPIVYAENTVGSYNVLSAATALGIERVCLASSINAIGGVFSQTPRYDYFPLDEAHPTYAEDPYSLSKWVLEQQADAFARRFPALRVASLRFHWILPGREGALVSNGAIGEGARKHLWAWTHVAAAARACLLALSAAFHGHEVFYIVAPENIATEPSRELAARHYPATPIRGEFAGHAGFFNCAKAERILGWRHEE
jgi:UDP-glucose 4-epimerase